MLGVTRQWTGSSWCGARGFQYAGSLGPILVSSEQLRALRRLGAVLARRFPLRGLFGVDAVLNARGVWTVEVNPRYSASLEILERSCGPLIPHHIAACRDGQLSDERYAGRSKLHAKAIVYARRKTTVSESLLGWSPDGQREQQPPIADIPEPGVTLLAGQPAATVFAEGERAPQVLRQLQCRVRALQAKLRC